MTVRRAIPTDKPAVVRLLRDSRQAAGFDSSTGATGFVFPFVPAYAERLFAAHVDHARCLCLIHDVEGEAQGVLMAIAYEHEFGPVWLARETVWFIDPAHRGRAAIQMLDAFERWADSLDCAFAGMAGMGNDPTVGKLYERRGYRPAERHYLKAL